MEYLVSGNEMAAMDQVTIEGLGVPGRALMEVAGRSVAAACKERVSEGDRVLIACGTGNNGGDGFVIARALADSGYDVSVTIFGNADDLKPDAASALIPVERTESISISFVADDSDLESFEDDLSEADLIVDALFGIGLHSDVRGHAAIAIDAINGSGAEIISVDIPSGVDSDSGVILGRAIDADTTVTFALPKRGHYIYPGAAFKGELVVADIGIDPALADELEVEGRLLRAHDLEDLLWARSLDAHKGDFGHLVIAAGSPATPGAAILAIHGALRAGVGLVSWSADSATMGKGTAPAEVMLRERSGAAEDAAAKTLEGASALVVGPGMSQ
ncbi:NAD(P)H-hydrate epimerase, partial [Myxococcota bacterium]|nr:NAD(P)H-hydrate epimerase [Myxococcota bacterium]